MDARSHDRILYLEHRVAKLTEALRSYHDLAPALAECANECGEAVLYSRFYEANQRADRALAEHAPAADKKSSNEEDEQ